VTLSRKALSVVYALIGVVAFVATWANVLGAVQQYGFWEGTIRFWQDTLVNGSSRFITVDLLFLGLAIVVWMVLEARRVGIPGVWVYVVLGLLVAISLTVPMFMVHRELRLAALEPSSSAGTLRAADVVGIVAMGSICATYAIVTLSR
jgi:uncharacterized protein DUF2834